MAALVHRKDRIDEAASTATVSTFFSGLLFTALALAASPLIGLAFDNTRIGYIAAASSGLLFVRALLIVPQALLQRRFSFLRRMVVEPISVIVFGAVAVVLLRRRDGPLGPVAWLLRRRDRRRHPLLGADRLATAAPPGLLLDVA